MLGILLFTGMRYFIIGLGIIVYIILGVTFVRDLINGNFDWDPEFRSTWFALANIVAILIFIINLSINNW